MSWQWRMMENLKRNWLVILKLTWGIWWILTRAIASLKKFHFNVLLLRKVYIFGAKTVKRSYLSSNWRGIQNLERNWFVVSKLAWGIWQILTWALAILKKFLFNGVLVTKVYCLSYKSAEELSFMTLKSHANFEEKLTCGLKKDLRSLANFQQSTWKCQNWDLDWIFLSKVEKVWL